MSAWDEGSDTYFDMYCPEPGGWDDTLSLDGSEDDSELLGLQYAGSQCSLEEFAWDTDVPEWSHFAWDTDVPVTTRWSRGRVGRIRRLVVGLLFFGSALVVGRGWDRRVPDPAIVDRLAVDPVVGPSAVEVGGGWERRVPNLGIGDGL